MPVLLVPRTDRAVDALEPHAASHSAPAPSSVAKNRRCFTRASSEERTDARVTTVSLYLLTADETTGVGMPVSFFSLYAAPLTTGDEKALLHAHLQLNRDALLWKLEGLSETDLRRPMTGTGTNLLGLVKHLTGVEGGILLRCVRTSAPALGVGRRRGRAMGEFSDMYAKPDETAEEIVASYRAATAAADQSIAALDLDATGRHHLGITVSLRWMLLTVLLDTARHAGHADIVREQIDGAAGNHRQWPGVAPADDEEYRQTYLARVRGEVDDESLVRIPPRLGSRRPPSDGDVHV